MDKVRVGVVGVGALGQHHARVYAGLPDVSLTGVVDLLPDRSEAIARPLGVASYTDYRELFGKVDAVSIATPTVLHAEIGEQFLDRGVHVLVEKPISNTLDGADRLIEAAGRNGRVLQTGHLERFNPAVRALREIVREPRFFEAHRMGLFSPRSLDIDVVLDLMIHDLDIISMLVAGASPVRVSAVGIHIMSPQIDIANARLEFQSGCVANITASRVSMEKIRKLRLFQQREYISLDYTQQEVAIFGLQGALGANPQITSRKLTPPKREPLREELSAFVDAVHGRSAVECSGEESRRALELALRILHQAKSAQALEIDRR